MTVHHLRGLEKGHRFSPQGETIERAASAVHFRMPGPNLPTPSVNHRFWPVSGSMGGPVGLAKPYPRWRWRLWPCIRITSTGLAWPPAEADMQRHFGVAPQTVHQMVLNLDRARLLIERIPGKPRSIRVLGDPDSLPILN